MTMPRIPIEIDEVALPTAARERLTRLRALARLGKMADRGDFDEFLGSKQTWPTRKAADEDDEDE